MPTKTVFVKASNRGEQCEFCGRIAKYAITSSPAGGHIFATRLTCCQLCSQQLGFELRKADRRMTDGEDGL